MVWILNIHVCVRARVRDAYLFKMDIKRANMYLFLNLFCKGQYIYTGCELRDAAGVGCDPWP